MDLASYGGFVAGGGTQSFGSGGDAYIVKTDSNGTSGCFESTVTFTVTSPPTVVSNITTLVSSGGVTNNPAITIGSVGTVNTNCFTVGINEADNILVNIYPNPSSGIFTIEFSEKISAIEIYNTLGEKIYQSTITTLQSEINLSNKPKGIYFLRIIAEDKIHTQKLIIQ